MMKFISLFVFIFSLWMTWHLTYSESSTPFVVHASLQAEVERLISEFVIKQRPNATDIRFLRIWTETINPQKVKVSFEYAFVDPMPDGEATEQRLQGSAILNRMEKTADAPDQWSLGEVAADTQTLIFRKGVEVPTEEKKSEQGVTKPPATETHSDSHH